MDNKSYAKCRLCRYKGGCAFNHNGDQELCELNVTYLDLTDHDKQIRDEVIDEFKLVLITRLNEYLLENGDLLDRYDIEEVAEKLKGEQNE